MEVSPFEEKEKTSSIKIQSIKMPVCFLQREESAFMRNIKYRDIETSLRDLLAAVLHGGWLIVVLGLAFALLLGGMELLNSAKIPEQPTSEFQQAMEKYEQDKKTLENALALEQRELKNLQIYMENSKRMGLDPNNKSVSTLVIAVSVEEVGTAYDAVLLQIQDQYAGLFKGLDLTHFTEGTEYENIPDKYLREVIELNSSQIGVLTLTVIGNEGTDGQEIASNIYTALLEKKAAVDAASYPHQLSKLTDAVTRTEVDLALEREQTEKLDKLENLRLSVLKLQGDLEALTKPTVATPKNEIVKTTVIGGMVGVILAVVWLVLRQMFAGKIIGGRQLAEDFQLPCIGNTIRPKGMWSRMAQLVAGDRTWKDIQAALDYIEGSADAYLPKRGSVALVSTLPQVDSVIANGIEKALSREDRKVVVVQDLFHNPKGLSAICDSEGVVLLEKTYQSKMVAVSDAIGQVEKLDKPIYGFVVM